jgi:hypothetical protein
VDLDSSTQPVILSDFETSLDFPDFREKSHPLSTIFQARELQCAR